MTAYKTIGIENEHQRLKIIPEKGGSVGNWDVRRANEWCPIWRPYSSIPSGERGSVSSFPLIPFSNLITGPGITVDQKFFLIRPYGEEPTPVHGNGWMHSWEVSKHQHDTIELFVDSKAKHDYPWDYFATQKFSLKNQTFSMKLEVTHLGEEKMPYGLGFHPFYLRGEDQGGPRLEFKASAYRPTDENRIPIDHDLAIPSLLDFNRLTALGETKVNNCYSGWDGRMKLERNDINLRLELNVIQDSDKFFAMLFTPHRKPFFCFEPVTHLPNALNMPRMPDMIFLEHGQKTSIEITHRISNIHGC